MRSRFRHYRTGGLSVLLSLLILSACAMPRDWRVASDENEGGIIGTITDIGSIYVNGLRITYGADLKVQTAFGEGNPEHLAPGDTVKVEAIRENGSHRALSIERYRPLIAPIEAIVDDQSWIQALGIRVQVDDLTRINRKHRAVDWRELPIGAWIAVDGIWNDKAVVASNVRRVEALHLASVRGVARKQDDGSLMSELLASRTSRFQTAVLWLFKAPS